MRSESTRSGVIETLFVLAAFVAFGLGWAEFVARAPAAGSPYPAQMVDDTRAEPSIWLLDGFNVLHAGPLGGRDRSEWWTATRRDELLEIAARFDDRSAEVWVVFDGPREADPRDDTSGPHPVFAPSADAWLLERVRAADDPGRIAIVTADRKVADRARHRGARVYSPRDFLSRCETPTSS
ncbi:MAG: NYN domain-containing protein [Deltaproteobacteria bacterium]|nr:NYN domain-containing protein [Deltaproteobacteria bacterium]MBW2399563.1 NYN domain-containing protein [Deltaproteobacteria bacterium]